MYFSKKITLFRSISIIILPFLLSSLTCINSTLAVQGETNENFPIVGFSDDILLSIYDDDYAQHVEPTLAIDDNDKIYVGWKNANFHNTGGVRVSFTRSDDVGETWTTPSNMPMFGGHFTGQSDPWLVYFDDVIYYAYLEFDLINPNSLSQITVARSTDLGFNWEPVKATDGEGFADKETMTIDRNGNIYVVYDDIADSYMTVRLSKSTDGGLTFQETGVIADSINQSVDHLAPYVTTDDHDNVFVAWTWFTSSDWGDIYITNSTDYGKTFQTRIDINPTSENGSFTIDPIGRPKKVTLPVIRFDTNNRLYALWSELVESDSSWGIFLRFSDDYGLSWSEKYRINPTITGDQWQPDLDIDSQNRLHISYYDQQGEYFKPYYRMAYFENYSTTEIILSEAIPIASENTSITFTRPGDYFTIRV
ncbi:MAG: sialidase family protein, partial [Candidatus Heimdallarchaeota archaeon]